MADEYDQWLKDFKKTDRYKFLVAKYKRDWGLIHEQLRTVFTNDMLLKCGDEEGPPLLEIDASQRDNFKRQYRAWMTSIKDTCPDREFFFGPFYDTKERFRYSRFFFKHLWDPEKTVDE